MLHTKGEFKGKNNINLFYQCWRPDTIPIAVLVILHGFGEHSGRYMNVVNQLVPYDWVIYGFDLRGHGQSQGQRGHINAWDEFRDDLNSLLQLINTSEPDRPVFLWGHSLGALIALEYVLRYPDGLRGVIASGSALGQVGISPFLFVLSRILSRIWPYFSLDIKLDASTLSRDPSVVKAYREDPLVHNLGTARMGTELTTAQAWTQAHAQELHLPLLMLHGCDDRLVSIDSARQFYEHVNFPDKEWHEYEAGYHEPHNDTCCGQVLTDVLRWLDRHRSLITPADSR